MTNLTPIELDDGTVIYVESTETENVHTPDPPRTRGMKEEGLITKGSGLTQAMSRFKSIEGTIKAYSQHTLNAFKELAVANVDKVTLEFGIKVGGEAGIPYVTKGTAESNLKITVACSFPKQEETENTEKQTC